MIRRLIIFTALLAICFAVAAALFDPIWLIVAAMTGALALLIDFLWHCAGNLARGRLEERQ